MLPELHALSSGLKATCTWMTADGIEACRRTCGGHGYSKLSGLPTLFQNYVQNVTWEGDNNVLCLQTARYLHKQLAAAAGGRGGGRSSGSAAYLNNLQQQLAARWVVGGEGGAYRRAVGRQQPWPCAVAAAGSCGVAPAPQGAGQGPCWWRCVFELLTAMMAGP